MYAGSDPQLVQIVMGLLTLVPIVVVRMTNGMGKPIGIDNAHSWLSEPLSVSY